MGVNYRCNEAMRKRRLRLEREAKARQPLMDRPWLCFFLTMVVGAVIAIVLCQLAYG